jgi:undecaprenyl-diphosphatase
LSVWAAALLGLVQGATEFLPVSSSGHLVLLQWLLGLHRPGVGLEVALHGGTLVALLAVFGQHLRRGWRRLWRPLLWASLPAAAAGLSLRSLASAAFDRPLVVGLGWLATGVGLLWGAARAGGGRDAASLRPGEALLVGLGQAVALLPGVSRSGAALVAGLAVGLAPREAAVFAFLLAIPSVGGAVLLELPGWRGEGSVWLGAGVAAFAGVLAMRWWLARSANDSLRACGRYCVVLGTAVLAATACGRLGGP